MAVKQRAYEPAAVAANSRVMVVLIEPREGHTDREVVESLKETGASQIKVLAPGHISAHINTNAVGKLKVLAFVRPKRMHRYLGGMRRRF
jgi:hypothetical protein